VASWDQQIFIGIRDQILLRFEYQGSELLAKKWDQRWKNIPRYDPAVQWVTHLAEAQSILWFV